MSSDVNTALLGEKDLLDAGHWPEGKASSGECVRDERELLSSRISTVV